MYALRQAIAKGIVAYYAKNEDAASALELKKALIQYDRTLLVADPRRMEPKKVRLDVGGPERETHSRQSLSSSVVVVPEQGDRNLTVKELPLWFFTVCIFALNACLSPSRHFSGLSALWFLGLSPYFCSWSAEMEGSAVVVAG